MTTNPTRGKSERPGRTRIAHPPTSSHQHAQKIADAVDEAWHRAHGTGNLHIPASVIAALSFISPPPDLLDATAVEVIALDQDRLAAVIRAQWQVFINYRPDLLPRAWVLVEPWFTDPPPTGHMLRAAKAVADAALRAGLFRLTGTGRRTDTDLFGPVLTVLRARSDRKARGMFYTPGDVANLMARVTVTEEGERVLEPAAGTGGMLRAVAEAMREQGRDPTTVTWIAVDIDELAIACLAINTVLWNLGGRVLLGVGDSLAGDDWMTVALGERQEALTTARETRHAKAMLTLLRLLDADAPRTTQPSTDSNDDRSENRDEHQP